MAVDKCISWFTERAKEKIIISIKPISIKIKIWVLSDNSYFVHWFLHTKEDNPQGISKVSKPLGRNKIVLVILIFLNTLPQTPFSTYNVILDNLFIFTKFLVYLLAEGFGACGTMRTNAGIYQELIDYKKSDKIILFYRAQSI